jgi:hypothetical protein
MFDDLSSLLENLPPESNPDEYKKAIIEENILYKKTHSTRKTTSQKLRSLYGLNPEISLFKYFRIFWQKESSGRPLLACLLANARDPVLRITAPSVLSMSEGDKFSKKDIKEDLRKVADSEFTENTINSTTRNSASTWTQSGHLKGQSKKIRRTPEATPSNTAFALLMGYLCGQTGELLFDTFWFDILDISKPEAFELTKRASQSGYLTYKHAGNVIDIDFDPILEERDKEKIHEQNSAVN